MSENTERLKIIGWSIIAEWNNGKTENIGNVDNDTAQMVDDYLTDYEKQVNDELNSKYKDIGDMDDESIRNLEFRFDNSISLMLK